MRAGISGTVARSVGAIRDRAVIRASRPMRSATSPTGQDRKSVGEGKRGDVGGGPINKKKKKNVNENNVVNKKNTNPPTFVIPTCQKVTINIPTHTFRSYNVEGFPNTNTTLTSQSIIIKL